MGAATGGRWDQRCSFSTPQLRHKDGGMKRRATKRIANRLAKKGFVFLRWEQADPHLVCMRAIVETTCKQRFARSFAFPTEWLKTSGAVCIRPVNAFHRCAR